MSVRLSTPAGLMQPTPYHHVAVATGARHVHVAGQIARTAAGDPVAPGDLAGQVAAALRNTATALAGVGASFGDVVRLTFYVTAWEPGGSGRSWRGSRRSPGRSASRCRCRRRSLIGVEYLFEPDVLVEVEATAVVD